MIWSDQERIISPPIKNSNNNQTEISMQNKILQENFLRRLNQISKEPFVTYYDFLIVAKQEKLRFQQSKDLITVKEYFSKQKNIVQKKLLSQMLMLNPIYLYQSPSRKQYGSDNKIVKFQIPQLGFTSIIETINEQQNCKTEGPQLSKLESKEIIGRFNNTIIPPSRQLRRFQEIENLETIVWHLNKYYNTLIESLVLKNSSKIMFLDFKTNVEKIFNNVENIKFDCDDLRKIFDTLDYNKKGWISEKQFLHIKQPSNLIESLRFRFIRSKSSKMNQDPSSHRSEVKFYHLNNDTFIQTDDIKTNREEQRCAMIKRRPRFGPLRNFTMKKQIDSNLTIVTNTNAQVQFPDLNAWDDRQKIERLLKIEKNRSEKKHQKYSKRSRDTITNKLRSLFNHKIIIPRQKIMQQEKISLQTRYNKKKVNSKKQIFF